MRNDLWDAIYILASVVAFMAVLYFTFLAQNLAYATLALLAAIYYQLFAMGAKR